MSETSEKPEKDYVIVASATPIGFRGSNDHLIVPKKFFEEILPKANQQGGESEIFSFIQSEARKPKAQLEKEKKEKMEDWKKTLLEKIPEEETENPETNEIPMEVLVHGVIAEGAAGRAGSGDQYIHIMHVENVLITNICGRLYGCPGLFITYFEGGKLKTIPVSEYGMND